MIEAGVFDEDEHLELLKGILVAMSPQRGEHAHAIERLNRSLVRALGDEYRVRPQLPLTLGDQDEPEPDLAVVPATPPEAPGRHPSHAALVIGVAGDSIEKDRTLKAAIYARAKIPEYWIVNLAERCVEVLTDPDSTSSRYRTSKVARAGETIVPRQLAGVAIRIGELFG